MGLDIAGKWTSLGRRLGVSDAELERIDLGYNLMPEKGYQMLKCWKETKGSAATYQALCAGLRDRLVKRQDLAEKYCYIKGNYFLQYLTWVVRSNSFECAEVRFR